MVCILAICAGLFFGLKGRMVSSASASEKTAFSSAEGVAYVFYANTWLSLNKEGIVCANSSSRPDGIPEITGIEFDNLAYGKKADPVSRAGLEYLIRIACSLSKHGIKAERIHYENRMATIYIGYLRIELGKEDRTDEKLTDLADLIDQIAGDHGTLYMQNGNANNYGYTFRMEH